MSNRVYKFSVELKSGVDVPSMESFPIYEDALVLVGAFTVSQGDRIDGFLAGSGYPLALSVSLGDDFYFTPVEGEDGKVSSAILSERSISAHSVKIRQTEEQ